ncbi:MAG TPA: sugar transferase [Novosphingobium sp.]|nr:sugar transferase [Novosphingobium sp.]
MHSSQTDLSRSPLKPDAGFLARAPMAVAEVSLIASTRAELVPVTDWTEGLRRIGNDSGDPGSPFARARDIVCGLALIVLLAPLLLLLITLVALCDPGPPIFAHVRVGRNGRLFKCYKLRSMYRDAEHRLAGLLADNPRMRREWDASFKLTDDPRVTPLGDFLRKSSLDELPQLFNVLAGSMTLVGPRPVVFDELRYYGRHALSYLRVKPGLTGLWQVTGRSEVSYRRRVATDRLYARRKSLLFDFQIMLATIPAVLARKGAW